MNRWCLLAASGLLFLGSRAAAEIVAIGSDPANFVKDVHAVAIIGGSEHRTIFHSQNGSWVPAAPLPLLPSQHQTIIIHYAPGTALQALNLDVLIDSATVGIDLVLAPPHARDTCSLQDEKEIQFRTGHRAEARDALAIIVQIDHLLAPRKYGCARSVGEELTRLRGDNLKYLHDRIRAIWRVISS
jgi:hypothetical protein